MIAARLRRQLQISAKKCCTQLGNQFFTGIAFITPALAPQITIKAALVLRPVCQLAASKRNSKRFMRIHQFAGSNRHPNTSGAFAGPMLCVGPKGPEWFGASLKQKEDRDETRLTL